MDDTVSAKAWTNYIDALDPDHTCFLAADIECLRPHTTALDDALEAGDLTFAYEAARVLRRRLTNRIAYAEQLIGEGFDFSRDETYSVPLRRAWPKTGDEWDDLWRKKVKNDVLRRLVNRELAGDAARSSPGPPASARPLPRGERWEERTIHLSPRGRGRADAGGPGEGWADGAPGMTQWVLGTFLTAVAHAYDRHSEYVPAETAANLTNDRAGTTTWSMRTVAKPLGVIRPSAFYRNGRESASRDIRRVLAHMIREGVAGVLLDLRGNPGGCQAETVAVTGLFIAQGPVVLTRETGGRIETHRDKDGRTAYAGPLVVLVDRATASAAEVLAGTLRDYGRAVVVGDSRTYGKGRCQTIHRLGRNDRLGKVSVSTLVNYTVSGRSCQGCGIAADIVLPSLADYCAEPDAEPEPLEPPVAPAGYVAVAELDAVISRLRKASERRRAEDVRYKARVAKLSTLARTRAVPLHLEKRQALVQSIRGLSELQVPSPDPAPDLVLEEALAILGDLAGNL